jgi:hypothetical protein
MTSFSSKARTAMRYEAHVTFALNDKDDEDKEGIPSLFLETFNYHRYVHWEEDDTLVGLQFAPSLDWEDDLSSDEDEEQDADEENNVENSHYERKHCDENDLKPFEIQNMNNILAKTLTTTSVCMKKLSTAICINSNSTKCPIVKGKSRTEASSQLTGRLVTNKNKSIRHRDSLLLPRSSRIICHERGMMKASSYTKCLSRDFIKDDRQYKSIGTSL